MRIKLFKTLLIVIPCLIVAVLCILAIPREDNYILDEMGDLEAFDEPEYVTNSEMGFFYKRDQLSTYRKQKKPDKVKNIKIADDILRNNNSLFREFCTQQKLFKRWITCCTMAIQQT